MKTKTITRTKKTAQEKKPDNISVILLCDSPGYRMKSYGPVSLVNINNYKLLDIQIEAIKESFSGFEIIICVGFDGDKICKYVRSKYSNLPIRVVENQVFNNSNSCESVRISINNTMNHRVLICDGSLLFTSKTLSCVAYDQSCVLIEAKPSENLDIGINVDTNKEAQHFSYGACSTWSEIVFFNNKDILESLRKVLSTPDYKNKFIFEALNELIKSKHKIRCITNKYQIKKINNIKTYHGIKGTK